MRRPIFDFHPQFWSIGVDVFRSFSTRHIHLYLLCWSIEFAFDSK